MKPTFSQRTWQALSAGLLITLLLAHATPAPAQDNADRVRNQQKILAGYFEEWSIYAANYNISNLQANGVANRISHLTYAFGNVAPPTGAPNAQCQLADTWADYQDP
jgi:chitinase